jgi:hypothetical protein
MRKGRKPRDPWKQGVVIASDGDDYSPSTLEALRRIGVSVDELRTAPRITEMLERADGGMKTVLAAMRFQADQTVQAFLAAYDRIPADDRRRVPIEAVALAAGVPVPALLGSIMISLQAQSVSLVKIIALTSHPRITAARAHYASLPGGHRDRTALDTALGLLPQPKGPTFIGKAIFGSGKSSMEQQRLNPPEEDEDDENEPPLAAAGIDGEAPENIDLDKLFPPANAMQEKLIAIRQKVLPSPGTKTGWRN